MPTQSRPAVVVTVLCTTGILASLVQTIIIPLVPRLPELLDAGPADASWAVTATLLVGAIMTPIAGRLGDMYGKRRVLALCLLSLIAGSALCALTSSLIPVTIGRGLQGVSMGVIALGISIMRDELPEERVGGGIAMMSATIGIGGAIGMPAAAIVAERADWHVVFAATGMLAAGALVAVLRLVPESPVRTGGRFDAVGALGLAAGLAAFLLAITEGAVWGWSSARTLGAFGAAAAVFALWSVHQLRVQAPLVDLRVSARPQVLFTNLASVAVGFAMFGMALIPPQLLMAPEETGYGLGLTMTQTALLIAPSGIVMFFCSPLSARISNRYGPRVTLMSGAIVIAAGYLVVLAAPFGAVQILIASIVVNGGIGIAYAAMPALIIAAVPVGETAAANGLNALMRSIGTSSSSAVISAVLATMTVTVAVGDSAGGTQELVAPTAAGFTTAAAVCLAAALVSTALTACVPRASRARATRTAPESA
ncbi:MFS transporter [Tomitella gaofuii]|uniref:MFS transporter n=1 Tax=Tomitella gaofuii TaxID=2760083 RepID=UPI0015F8F66B|nr:MFS transporter [Tomitella gaofuii]